MTKKENLSEWYHKVLEDAEIVDARYAIKGMLIYRKWGLLIIREMQRALEKMLEEKKHEPVLFPVLIPEDILGKETKHIAGFENEVFWVTHAGANELERRLALRPTSETPIYEMFSLWIRSHQDLPLKVHQSCAVYRYETKHTRPLIRGREFLWNEGHSAHADPEDAKRNIKEIREIYAQLISGLLCIPFAVNERPEWDRFPGADHTYAFDTLMPDGKTLQIATVHDLGQNFSKVFDITYETAGGEHEHVYQTSYGPSLGRLLASVISIHGDDIGLILPPALAPIQVIIIPIIFKESDREGIMRYAEDVERRLQDRGIRTDIDRGEGRPGAKFYFWEMKGVPVRIEVGPRDLNNKQMVVVRRDNKEKITLKYDQIDEINEIFTDISKNMRKNAEKRFKEGFSKAGSLEEISRLMGEGIIEAGWCGRKECAENIEEYADILSVDDKTGECVVCGKKGTTVRVAKTY
ncbi:MAG: proline--tRNA ligase [Candidatus Altiarchaeales archaeon]|nr:proline--tRNA ligase [Candidatus Altiarchaeales archaeon]